MAPVVLQVRRRQPQHQQDETVCDEEGVVVAVCEATAGAPLRGAAGGAPRTRPKLVAAKTSVSKRCGPLLFGTADAAIAIDPGTSKH